MTDINKKEQKISLLFSIFIIFHFIFAFFYQENAGGGKIDEIHILNNFNLFYNNNLFEIDWSKYDSTSLPFIYIFYNLIINTNDYYQIIYLNLFISFVTFLFFYGSLLKVFNQQNKYNILLISACIFLSPYFRTSTFFALEENLAIFFTMVGFYLFFIYQNVKKIFILVFCFFFLALAVYSRSYYIIIYLLMLITCLDKTKFLTKKNILISIFSFLLSLPVLYILFKWKGIVPPVASSRTQIFSFYNNFPIIFNIILIYTLPFFLIEIKNIDKKVLVKKLLFFVFFFPFYYFFFHNIEINQFGGGALNKLLFLFFSEQTIRSLTILISYFSILILFVLFLNKFFIIGFVVFACIVFSNLSVVFQEYFDPLTFIILLLFGDISIFREKIYKYFLFVYFYLFLLSSIYYQYIIV